ncbi:hypothetical protein LQG66_29435 [Bradyrhizobium ontarionense]|uniref:Uncharacterized protein n=1 Tax=Bradyrhizobium ontarionense TaxID=2898149 RepID=A0ABY3R8E3_9BRAD|nr:hypothetical protein [Bradyrhizobium sp. A19]UFZ03317.1 hypothetical protein LQG66_29435 [Bradyrhizobium sp. A19]
MATATFREGFRDGTFPELSGRDFDAYLAARVLTAEELATIDPVTAVVLRAKLRSQILASDEIRKLLRGVVEPELKSLAARKP